MHSSAKAPILLLDAGRSQPKLLTKQSAKRQCQKDRVIKLAKLSREKYFYDIANVTRWNDKK